LVLISEGSVKIVFFNRDENQPDRSGICLFSEFSLSVFRCFNTALKKKIRNMHAAKKAEITSPIVTLGDAGSKMLVFGAVGGVILVVGSWLLSNAVGEGWTSFLHVYLTNFLFFLSISLGALFFVIMQHLTRAGWSVAVRRIAEILAATTPLMALLFLPILLAVILPSLYGSENGILYIWNDADYWKDTLNPGKRDFYLNATAFTIRAAIYFVAWWGISSFFLNSSRIQDENGDSKLTAKMQFWSAPSTLLFAITVIFASFDWSMSLSPAWFSTIFPIYFFAGGMMGALCTIILILLILQKNGIVSQDVTVEHYHDLAKFTFGFVFFWGYIAFSQFLLIWYANIPEETVWYLPRMRGRWAISSLILLFGHLLIPFLMMMPRTLRRSKDYLWYAVIFLLVMHWYDHFWIIMPQMYETFKEVQLLGDVASPVAPEHMFGPVEACCFLGMALIYSAFFCWIAGDRSLIPLRDPRLRESLNFKVH